MDQYDYWNLFWLSGLPEAWMMSRPERGDFNTADMTAKAVPHRGGKLPGEVRWLYSEVKEQGKAEMSDSSLSVE